MLRPYQNILLSFTGILVSIAALSAAGIPATNSAPPASRPAALIVVSIDNFNFTPKVLTITAGTTVTWVNHDDVPHTATEKGNSPAFDSKALDTDDKYSFTFTKAGTFEYYCKVHPHMTGTVIVK